MPTNNSSSSKSEELPAAQIQAPSTKVAKMDLDGTDSPWGGKYIAIARRKIECRSLLAQTSHQAQPHLNLQILQALENSPVSQSNHHLIHILIVPQNHPRNLSHPSSHPLHKPSNHQQDATHAHPADQEHNPSDSKLSTIL